MVSSPYTLYLYSLDHGVLAIYISLFIIMAWIMVSSSYTFSLVSLDQANVGTSATLNLKILRLVARADNALGLGYNNVEVLIQNHFFCSRPAGV